MKRTSIIIMTLALLVALTHCKKEQVTPVNENEIVSITLDIRSNGGTRMDVNTETGEVFYEEGDLVYVVSGGKFIGTLTYNGTNFSGPITNPTVGEPLHFYFLGNVTPVETLTAGATESCSVVISDQTEHLPVIEYAPSDENYTAGATAFSAFLLNKCALVKFNVITSSETATCVTGFNNKVTVDFNDASFTYSKVNGGNITLPAGSGEKWAILLPQDAMDAGEVGSAYSVDGEYTGTRGAVPAVLDNGFLTNGIAVTVNTSATSIVPIGAISGLFTINANGDQVYFSQGNLQYQASTNTWRFAENQWGYVGNDNTNISPTYDGWIDLFGWGTSGYNHGAICFHPWSTSLNDSDYYVYGGFIYNLFDQTGQADWGYNAINNGSNQENNWRTMTSAEWNYILEIRTTLSGIRFAKAQVNNVNGVLLLPDTWNTATFNLSNTNANGAPFCSNVINESQWIALENAGVVFLATGGTRVGTSIIDAGSRGYYWLATFDPMYDALYVIFSNSSPSLYTSYGGRGYGRSVRLVRNAQ